MSGKRARRERQSGQSGQSGQDRSQSGAAAEAAYQARVSQILGGQTPQRGPLPGVRALFRCPACGSAWLQDPAAPHGARLRLGEEELAALAAELRADLGRLPYATCRICGAAHGEGEYCIDEYGRGQGYGVSWEGVDPAGAHLVGTVLRLDWLQRQQSAPSPDIVTRPDRMRAVLAHLAQLTPPAKYRPYTPEDSAALASGSAPGHGAEGTAGWVWRGCLWVADCPALEGPALYQLSQAMPPSEPFSVALLFAGWRAIAAQCLRGRIAGEELLEDPEPGAAPEGEEEGAE